MPKVKLSALVSDMKGKANGSVFSSNGGGLYYRNNPAGGGRRSALWDKQKANFSNLASSWRSLSTSEQDSWNAAAPLWPTTDAFGEPRIPSGYELFMRLNGALSALGQPTLVVPGTQRAFPLIDEIQEDFQDMFQLNPNAMINLYDVADPDANVYVESTGYWSGVTLASDGVFAMRVDFQRIDGYPLNTAAPIKLFGIINGSNQGIRAEFIDMNTSIPKLRVVLIGDAGNSVCTVDMLPEDFDKALHVAIERQASGFNDTLIAIDGIQQTVDVVEDGNQTSGAITADLIIGQDNSNFKSYIAISDFREFDMMLNDNKILWVSLGYIQNSEHVIVPAYEVIAGQLQNFANPTIGLTFIIQGVTGDDKLVRRQNNALIPNFTQLFADTPEANFLLLIYGSPALSLGKSGAYSRFKFVASFDTENMDEVFVYNEYRDVYGNVPPDSAVLWEWNIIDLTTGGKATPQNRKGKKKRGFKAGSELSSQVN